MPRSQDLAIFVLIDDNRQNDYLTPSCACEWGNYIPHDWLVVTQQLRMHINCSYCWRDGCPVHAFCVGMCHWTNCPEKAEAIREPQPQHQLDPLLMTAADEPHPTGSERFTLMSESDLAKLACENIFVCEQ